MKEMNSLTMTLKEGITLAINSHLSRLESPGIEPSIYYLIAKPGIGKSEATYQYTAENGIGFIGCEPGLQPEEKFSGIPDIVKNIRDDSFCETLIVPVKTFNHKTKQYEDTSNTKSIDQYRNYSISTKWSCPELVDQLWEASRLSKRGVICLLDDFHLCNESIQKYMFEMETHRAISGHKIPDDVTFVLAGNDSAMAGAKIQFSAIRNRTTMINLVPDINSWIHDYAIPKNVNRHLIDFFSSNANRKYFMTEESTSEQFASPRSWTKGVSSLLNMIDTKETIKDLLIKDVNSSNPDYTRLHTAIAGSVGNEAATAFIEYYAFYRLVNTDVLFDNGRVEINGKNDIELFVYSVAITNEYYDRFIKNITSREKLNKINMNFGKALEALKVKNKDLVMRSIHSLLTKKPVKINNTLISGNSMCIELAKQSLSTDIMDSLKQILSSINK
jgi:hypothetical protein